jgi:hypothetical protein
MRKLGTVARDVAAASLYRTGEKIMTRSKEEFVPVDFGTLRSSGHVVPGDSNSKDVEVILGFGGPAGVGNQGSTNKKRVGYAVVVHENPNARHTVGQWKYLETPVKEAISELVKDLSDDIDEAFKGVK